MDRRKIIYQDDAIDALCKSECGCNNAECRHRDNTDFCVTCDSVNIIKSLPSVQPETNCSEIPNNSDTISRQAAIDALRKMQTYKLFAEDDLILIDQAGAQTELMMLPPAQPVQRWIPCSERLPNKFEDVWVTDNRGRTAVCHRGHSGWRDAESGDWMYCLDSIVAWMPYYVPEPYQERSKDA